MKGTFKKIVDKILRSMIGLFLASPLIAHAATSSVKTETPVLNVDIPGLKLSEISIKGNVMSVNYLSDYISAMYDYILDAAVIVAIVMVMIGGLQYALAGGHGETSKAKKRVKDAITGLVLLASVYLLLWTVSPQLVSLNPVRVDIVDDISLTSLGSEENITGGSVAVDFQAPVAANITGPGVSEVPKELAPLIEAAAAQVDAHGYGIYIASSYRTIEKQRELILIHCNNPPGSATCNPKDKTYACMLRDGKAENCPHTTGRAIDMWATCGGTPCVTKSQCDNDPAVDKCRKDAGHSVLITAMKAQGFCLLDSEAWHFENPKMSRSCK